MTPMLLFAIGRALHGDEFQAPLAREMGISRRTIHRWLAGDNAISEARAADLLKMLRAREQHIATLIRQVEAHVSGGDFAAPD